jgi:hypothetical protein
MLLELNERQAEIIITALLKEIVDLKGEIILKEFESKQEAVKDNE